MASFQELVSLWVPEWERSRSLPPWPQEYWDGEVWFWVGSKGEGGSPHSGVQRPWWTLHCCSVSIWTPLPAPHLPNSSVEPGAVIWRGFSHTDFLSVHRGGTPQAQVRTLERLTQEAELESDLCTFKTG